MSFELRNSVRTFQWFIHYECRRLPFHFLYMNDIPVATSSPPDHHFDSIHLHIVGLFPPSRGYRDPLTCVASFTRWPNAALIPNITARTVARVFVATSPSLFEFSSIITTNKGRQFDCQYFTRSTPLVGSQHVRTTAYPPAASKGMVKQFHRQLKASYITRGEQEHLYDHISLVLLGIRSHSSRTSMMALQNFFPVRLFD